MGGLLKAISLAMKAHEGQKDKAGLPYALHPLRVMQRMHCELDKTVAVLHDVLEDTDVTMERLHHEGFPEEVIKALDCLTRRPGESYDDYVTRLSGNLTACKVKLVDLEDNMDIGRLASIGPEDVERLRRYHAAWTQLRRRRITPCHLADQPVPHERDFDCLETIETIFEWSHAWLYVRRCTVCGQLWLDLFLEIVDWDEGDDDIWCFWLPATEEQRQQVRETPTLLSHLIQSNPHITKNPAGKFYWTDQPEIALFMGAG